MYVMAIISQAYKVWYSRYHFVIPLVGLGDGGWGWGRSLILYVINILTYNITDYSGTVPGTVLCVVRSVQHPPYQ